VFLFFARVARATRANRRARLVGARAATGVAARPSVSSFENAARGLPDAVPGERVRARSVPAESERALECMHLAQLVGEPGHFAGTCVAQSRGGSRGSPGQCRDCPRRGPSDVFRQFARPIAAVAVFALAANPWQPGGRSSVHPGRGRAVLPDQRRALRILAPMQASCSRVIAAPRGAMGRRSSAGSIQHAFWVQNQAHQLPVRPFDRSPPAKARLRLRARTGEHHLAMSSRMSSSRPGGHGMRVRRLRHKTCGCRRMLSRVFRRAADLAIGRTTRTDCDD